MEGQDPSVKVEEDSLDLDALLPKIGEFGRYQKMLIFLVCLPSCIPCGFGAFNQLFMTNVPDHWCKVPELIESTNLTQEQRRNISIPFDESLGSYDKCSRFVADWSEILSYTQESKSLSESNLFSNKSFETEGCVDGWEFDYSEVSSSIVIDYELVCKRAVYPTLGLVALNIGGPIGVYTFGILNDKIGRKKSFFACLTTLMIGGLMTAFATEYWFWALSRAIVGLTIPAIYQIPFIISLELVGPNYRSFVTVMTCLVYAFGVMVLAGVTYLVRDWKTLALVTSAPFLVYYLYWLVLPESPRWLLMRGRLQEANEILERIAQINGKPLPKSFTEKLEKEVQEQRRRGSKGNPRSLSLFALCKTPNLRLKTILITLNWFASEMVYVGLSYYGPSLGSNQYVSFFLTTLVEVPSYIVCWLVMDKIGRRWLLCTSMVISGIFCMITVLLPTVCGQNVSRLGGTILLVIIPWARTYLYFRSIIPFILHQGLNRIILLIMVICTTLKVAGLCIMTVLDAVITTLVFYLISKCFISASFLIIYPYAGEIYPTELRGIGIGTSSYIGGLGLIIIPFVNYLGSSKLVVPLVVMGAVSVAGGLTALRLPETLHARLPDTLEEGERFGQHFSCRHCCSCDPTPMSESETYESLDQVELTQAPKADNLSEEEERALRRNSMKKLIRQASVLETQRDVDGTIKMTYWF